ncbi:MAG: bifunctional 4-hydroxy-2-oxoglutarate aldolase/2-dehydro-3-deoxy-phosphogluconate aldolase [Planctomycetota bacterium]
MNRHEQVQMMLDHKLIAVVRSPDGDKLVEVAKALLAGGIPILEITLTVPDALEVIRRVRNALGDNVLLGAGTVLDAETARAALLAGAEFIVSPITNLEVIRLCRRYDKPILPGAFTPTEIVTAWENGADIVKVFPADVGGPNYFKALAGPLPQVRIMPTGGVDLTTAASFLQAGACCLGLGSALVDKKAVAAGDMNRIRTLAEQYVAVVREATTRA